MDIIDALQRQEHFTETDIAISQYILKNLSHVTKLNINELAREAYVSTSAIMRLCRRVGLDGYRSFRLELSRDIERLAAPQEYLARYPQHDRRLLLLAVLQNKITDRLFRTVNPASIKEAASIVASARRVFVSGGAEAMPLLQIFSSLLVSWGTPCLVVHPHDTLHVIDTAMADSPDEILVVVSYGDEYARELARHLRATKMDKRQVILITADGHVIDDPPGAACILRLPERTNPQERLAPFYNSECIRHMLTAIYGEMLACDPTYGEVDLALSSKPKSKKKEAPSGSHLPKTLRYVHGEEG